MKKALLGGLLAFLVLVNPAFAYNIEKLSDIGVHSDMVLSSGPEEVFLDPGGSAVRSFVVTNRTGYPQEYEIEIEDVKGSDNIEVPILFLGDEVGPYSLKDYLKPEITEFTLQHGERITIPVSIEIPLNAEPGGLYGTVIVRQLSNNDSSYAEIGKASGGVEIVERLASIYYVRVRGDAEEGGDILGFSSDKKFYAKPPVNLSLSYKNTGNVHLKPSGTILVKNMINKDVAMFKVDPFFVLPGSTISRSKTIESMFMFGRYTAELSFNHDHDGKIENRKIAFWVIPWQLILLILAILLVLVYGYHRLKKWFNDNFEKKEKVNNKKE